MIRATTESSAAWLGKVPAEWRVVPAAALFSDRKTKSLSSDVHLTPSQKYGVLPQTEYMSRTGNKVVLNLTGADNMRHVEPGDFVSHLRSFQGGLEYSTVNGKVSAAYTVLKPSTRNPVHGPYFRYLFKSTQYIQALQTTTDQLRDGQSIRYAQFKLIPLPLPPLDEQRAIADYLDRETAQIDVFIAKNEELIVLLTHRYQSGVKRLVLGLDIDEPRRICRDPWVVDIPNSWKVSRVSRWYSVTLGKMLDEKAFGHGVGENFPYIRAGNIKEDRLNLSDLKFMPFSEVDKRKFALKAGDLLVVEGGSIGLNQVLDADMPGVYFQKTVNRVRSLGGATTEYLGFVLDAMRRDGILAMHANVSTIAHLTAEKLERIVIPMPSPSMQAAIVGEAKSLREATWLLLTKAQEAIRLAKERRAALISAAVTGKIDVRSKA